MWAGEGRQTPGHRIDEVYYSLSWIVPEINYTFRDNTPIICSILNDFIPDPAEPEPKAVSRWRLAVSDKACAGRTAFFDANHA